MAYSITTNKSWASTKAELANCFALWGVRDWEVNANVMESRATARDLTKQQRAVTVRYIKDGKPIELTLDAQSRPVDNLRALFLCVDDMRLIEHRGLSETVKAAYMQLAGPAGGRDPWEVLGLRPGASKDDVEAMYRVRAKTAHPDAGGSGEAMAELNAARDRVLAEVR